MKTLLIDVWSDVACPWCWDGKRRLERALERFPDREEVVVRWRAFELDPAAPRAQGSDEPYAKRLAKKYRTGLAEAQAMIDRMAGVGAKDGLSFRFDRIQPGNTFFALAGRYGVSGAQPADLLLRAIEKAWADLPDAPAEGPACAPEGCA